MGVRGLLGDTDLPQGQGQVLPVEFLWSIGCWLKKCLYHSQGLEQVSW